MQKYILKEDTSSPMFDINLVMITLVIEAKEGCNMVLMDFPGASLHAEKNEYTMMMIYGQLAEMMVLTVLQTY